MAWREEYNDVVTDLVIQSPGKDFYLDPTSGSDGGSGKKNTPVKTFPTAYSMLRDGKNDRIIYAQGTSGISLATDPLWSKNMSRLTGYCPDNYGGMRTKIANATDYGAIMMTLSGYGNLLQNLYLQHGEGSANGHVMHDGLLISGNYNTLKRIHINSPISTGLASASDYAGAMRVTGTGFQYFKDSTFGNLSIARSGATPVVTLGVGTNCLFEDCIFLIRISNTTPYFFTVQNTASLTQASFKRCQFICMSDSMATTMAAAFLFTGSSTCAMIFDSESTFVKVTLITAAGSYGYIWVPAGAATDKLKSVILS